MRVLLTLTALLASVWVHAQVSGTPLVYGDGAAKSEGYVARDPTWTGKRPVVMIVHDWDGLGAYEQERARQVAALGYIGFAVDIYGQGVRPETMEARRAETIKYSQTPERGLERLRAALAAAAQIPGADPDRVVAIGYCFGGGQVLNAARAGLPLAGVVSFHGSLASPLKVADAAKVPKMVVFHAVADPAVPRDQFASFLDEMSQAKADFQVVVYNLAVHVFTVKGGPQYDADADRRSWAAFESFLQEVVGKP